MTQPLSRRVLAELLGVPAPAGPAPQPNFTGYSLTRRVLAGLFGISLPPRDPPPAASGEVVAARARPSLPESLKKHLSESFTVPGWRESMVAASGDDSSPVQRQPIPVLGLELVRVATDEDETVVGIESVGKSIAADAIVRVYAIERDVELLIVVHEALDGTMTGQVVTPEVSMSDPLDIAVVSVAELTSIPDVVIIRSVRQATNAGRAVWRRIAGRLSDNDPVRAAIGAGLS